MTAILLLGTSLSNSGIATARLAGIALVSLGVASWPSGAGATQAAIRALFLYNVLAALLLGYLRVAGGFTSYLLWPACIAHALLGVLLAGAAFGRSVSASRS